MTNGSLVYLRLIFTPLTAGRLTLALNEKAAPVQRALDALLPTLVGGVLNQRSDGTGTLYQLLTTRPLDAGLRASQLMDTDAHHRQRVAELGIALLGQLYGQQTYQLIGSIAQYSRLNVGSAITLTGLATWVLLDFLQKQLTDHSLDQAQLAGWLQGEAESVWRSIPPDLARSLGWFLGPNPQESVLATTAKPEPVAQPDRKSVAGQPWRRWLLYLLLAGLLLVLVFRGCRKDKSSSPERTSGAITERLATPLPH